MTKVCPVTEALNHIRFGMDFAYENGLHEFGYDPVAVVADALAARRPDPEAGLIEGLQSEIGECLHNLPHYAKETGLSSDEVSGMQYAWSYVLASIDDRKEIAALNPSPALVGDEDAAR